MRRKKSGRDVCGALLLSGAWLAAAEPDAYLRKDTWWETMRASREGVAREARADAGAWRGFWEKLAADFPDATAEGLSRSLDEATRLPEARDPVELHVSHRGSDDATGTRDHPFATLGGAVAAIRGMKRDGSLPRPVVVTVHAGTYWLSGTLRLGPEDSGTRECPIVYRAAEGERVVLSGGAPLAGRWSRDEGGVWCCDVSQASTTLRPGKFHQLFVNGERAVLARYPNADPRDPSRKGWLHARGEPETQVLAGLGNRGDWAEYAFEIPKAGAYALWVGVAAVYDQPHRALALKIDGVPVQMQAICKSGGFRQVAFSKAAVAQLAAGRHTMRWESAPPVSGGRAPEIRIHLDAFCFSDRPDAGPAAAGALPPPMPGETRVVVEAEDAKARTGGESRAGFIVIPFGDSRKTAAADRIICDPGTIKASWLDAPQAEIYLFPAWGWFNAVARADRFERNVIQPTPGRRAAMADVIHLRGREAATPVWPGNRFHVCNVRAELDAPGEWYLDYSTRRLFYRLRPGESLDTAEVIAPRLERLVELVAASEGGARVEYVTLRGFTFAHTDWTRDQPDTRSTDDCAVLLENAWHCAVENCEFTNIGGYAVRLCLDSCMNRVAGNMVAAAGAGGVILRGPWVGWGKNILTPGAAAAILYPCGNLITGNRVHHSGAYKKYVAGVHLETRPDALAYAPGNVVSRNLIHHMPRNGIFGFRFQGAYAVEYNHIHDVLEESDDGGLIHFCAAALNGTAPAVIRGNLLHDVRAYRWDDEWLGRAGIDARSNGHGVYLDGDTSRVLVENNIIANTRRGCIFIHDGENNTVRNNILLEDRHNGFWQTKTWRGNRFENNIVCWTNDAPFYATVAIKDAPADGDPAQFDRNVIWHGGRPFEIENPAPFDKRRAGSFDDWRARGFDRHSLVADPRFEIVDLPNRVCRLAPDSPALPLGFKPIDLSGVGPKEK